VLSVPSSTTFTYTAPNNTTGLANGSGGQVASTRDDITLVGASHGKIAGSLLINTTDTSINFSAATQFLLSASGSSSVVLPDDTYTLTLVSGAGSAGFLDTLGVGLDGMG